MSSSDSIEDIQRSRRRVGVESKVPSIDDLQDRIAALQHCLGEALEQVRVAGEAESEFWETTARRIRGPMNSLVKITEILTGTALDAQQREYVDILLRNEDELLAFVRDAQSFSQEKDRSAEPARTDIDFLSTVSIVTAAFRPIANAKNIDLCYQYHFALPRRVKVDEYKIRQILTHLLNNAFQFTKEGTIGIDINNEDRSGQSYLRIQVRDTGIGTGKSLAELTKASLTTRENTAGASSLRTRSGLEICQHYAALLGGELRLTSTLKVGSCFTFTMPYTAARSVVLRAISDRGVGSQAPQETILQVLIVEDDPVCKEVLGMQVAQLGHRPRLAQNSLDAVELFSVGDYDLVLIDCSLGACADADADAQSGTSLAKALRKLETEEDRIPAHIVAHISSDQRGREAFDRSTAGMMNDALIRPCSLPALSKALSAAFLDERGRPEPEPVLNLGTIAELRSLSGVHRFLDEVIVTFLSDAANCIAELRCAAREEDLAMARKLSIRLKNACAVIGAQQMAGTCDAMLVIASRQEQTPTTQEWLARLRAIDDSFNAVNQGLSDLPEENALPPQDLLATER